MPEHNAVPDDESQEQPSLEDFGDPGAGGHVWEHDFNAREILTTRGIASAFYDEHGDEMGHIIMADYDAGHDGDTMTDELADRGGINILAESSPGSYHYYNLGMRPKDTAACELLELHGDANHVANGYRLNRWTLRIAPKRRQGDDKYKDAPEIQRVWYNDTDRPQSRPHWNFMRAWFDIPPILEGEDVRLVGRGCPVEEYVSITEELKAELWPDNE